MPGFASGIAQSQTTNQAQPMQLATNMSASRPWEYTYMGSQNTAAQHRGGYGGAAYTNGPQGQGTYVFNSPAQNAMLAQQYYAKQFQGNESNLENQLGSQLSSQANSQMGQNLNAVRQNNSRRGLLFGGVNAGQEGAVRSGAAQDIASGRSSINQGVVSAGNQMNQDAINTGVAIQQQQQQVQNAIYSQAMASMQSQNAAIGGLLGAGGAVLGGYLAGPAVAAAGVTNPAVSPAGMATASPYAP